jgi:methylglutaconyl-CoA hydratase
MDKAAITKYTNLVDEHGNETGGRVVSLIINRPQSANSFNGDILDAITEHLERIQQDSTVRALLFQSVGKHFSAGADLNWMQESARLSESENKEEAQRLIRMFEALNALTIPTIAVVKGAAYGGAVGIVACCDYAVATENAKFCLSEVRVGLIPAVILPYLGRKMHQGGLRRLTLSGRVFSSDEAKKVGLVQETVETMILDEWLKREVNHLLLASPKAQKAYKQLQNYLNDHSNIQGDHTANAIAAIRASEEGQKGLQAFFDKSEPEWVAKVKDDQPLLEI